MRLPLIPPAQLSAEQRPLYDDMRKGICSSFRTFKAVREDGALMAPWLHDPAIGSVICQLALAMKAKASLRDEVRQTAILVVGARYNAAYELYTHVTSI